MKYFKHLSNSGITKKLTEKLMLQPFFIQKFKFSKFLYPYTISRVYSKLNKIQLNKIHQFKLISWSESIKILAQSQK